MVVELMGHTVGWLALGAGLAGGADVILLPEIPHDVETVSNSIIARKEAGSAFSIVAVAEGAISAENEKRRAELVKEKSAARGERKETLKKALKAFVQANVGGTTHLASHLSDLTGLESRVTILGHVQRGGTPTPADRLLATRLGTACADFIADGVHGVMVAARGQDTVAVPLKEVAGKIRCVPRDHSWVLSARRLGISLGD
jgi:6-phosphofructokinase 1